MGNFMGNYGGDGMEIDWGPLGMGMGKRSFCYRASDGMRHGILWAVFGLGIVFRLEYR